MTAIMLDNDLRTKAEWYILLNFPEIQRYIEYEYLYKFFYVDLYHTLLNHSLILLHYKDDHIKVLEESGRGQSFDVIQVKEFSSWFSDKVCTSN